MSNRLQEADFLPCTKIINSNHSILKISHTMSNFLLKTARPFSPRKVQSTGAFVVVRNMRFFIPFAVIVACDSVVLNAHQSSLRRNHNVKLSCYFSTTAMLVVKPFFTEMPQSRGALMKRSTSPGTDSCHTHRVLPRLYGDQDPAVVSSSKSLFIPKCCFFGIWELQVNIRC